jgi:hypothetical protein
LRIKKYKEEHHEGFIINNNNASKAVGYSPADVLALNFDMRRHQQSRAEQVII